jgi:hypothetical protein
MMTTRVIFGRGISVAVAVGAGEGVMVSVGGVVDVAVGNGVTVGVGTRPGRAGRQEVRKKTSRRAIKTRSRFILKNP